MRTIGIPLEDMKRRAIDAVDAHFGGTYPIRRVSPMEDIVTAFEAARVLQGEQAAAGFAAEARLRGLGEADLAQLVSDRLAEVWAVKNRRIAIKQRIAAASSHAEVTSILAEHAISLAPTGPAALASAGIALPR